MNLVSKIPNILTFSRILATILMVLYYMYGENKFEVLFIVFVIASISDFFDGFLSRKLNATSAIGRCFDPISDKLLVFTAIFILIHANSMNLFVAFLLIFREVIVSGLREFLSLSKIELPVSRIAKWKTAFQLVAISMCFFIDASSFITYYKMFMALDSILLPLTFIIFNIVVIKNIVLSLAVITSFYTGFIYILHARKHFK